MRLVMLLGIAIALSVGLWMSTQQMQNMGAAAGTGSAAGLVDAVAVKAVLLSMAGAERQQFALEGRYVSLDELRAKGVDLPLRQGPYVFSAEVTDSTFLIKATFEVPEGKTPQPTLTIGPDMKVK